MSRSIRKRPYVTQQQSGPTKWAKRQATRRVRDKEEVANGAAYKKVSCSWDICDWAFYDPKQAKRK